MQVDAVGELGEDVGFVLGDGLQELAYVIAGAQLELSRQLEAMERGQLPPQECRQLSLFDAG